MFDIKYEIDEEFNIPIYDGKMINQNCKKLNVYKYLISYIQETYDYPIDDDELYLVLLEMTDKVVFQNKKMKGYVNFLAVLTFTKKFLLGETDRTNLFYKVRQDNNKWLDHQSEINKAINQSDLTTINSTKSILSQKSDNLIYESGLFG